jgi:hypothetical protein
MSDPDPPTRWLGLGTDTDETDFPATIWLSHRIRCFTEGLPLVLTQGE